MAKTILVAGFGPGISAAVAERFAREGFAVALVARNAERLDSGVAALTARGVRAAAFPADLGDAEAVRGVVERVRTTLGPVAAIHWNAYSGTAGDLLTASADEIRGALDIATTSLAIAVQAALPDLRDAKGAVLVTNGGFGMAIDAVDEVGVKYNAMGLAVANAAKHKLVRLLAVRLAKEDVFVGEVMVTGAVKGTAFDQGNANLEASAIAEAFWKLHRDRTERRVTM